MPFTPRSKQVLERSLRNAVARGDKRIGSEHILLGILDVPETVAAEALGKLGVTPDRLRQQLGAT
jgi:ATP-dependent Clp protease ATP-binding subunit ClpA